MGSKDRRNQGKHFKASDLPAHDYDLDSPAFCLRYIDRAYCITKCSQEQQGDFIASMLRLSQMTWRQILLTNKKSKLGSEKLQPNVIARPRPKHIAEDQSLIAIRFWEKGRMVGYRERDVFRIIWFDCDYSLYFHGG
jgi:hypothetical protein